MTFGDYLARALPQTLVALAILLAVTAFVARPGRDLDPSPLAARLALRTTVALHRRRRVDRRRLVPGAVALTGMLAAWSLLPPAWGVGPELVASLRRGSSSCSSWWPQCRPACSRRAPAWPRSSTWPRRSRTPGPGLAMSVCAGSSLFLTAATAGPLAESLTERAGLTDEDGRPLRFGFGEHLGPGLLGFAITLAVGLGAALGWR